MSGMRLEMDDGVMAFEPGGAIRGQVWLGEDGNGVGGGDSENGGGELRLFWYTEGKGTRDVGVVESVRVEGGDGRGGVGFEFAFVAPNGPYSFSGALISLIWALELVADDEKASERLEITIGPGGVEVDLSVFPMVEKKPGWRIQTR